MINYTKKITNILEYSADDLILCYWIKRKNEAFKKQIEFPKEFENELNRRWEGRNLNIDYSILMFPREEWDTWFKKAPKKLKLSPRNIIEELEEMRRHYRWL